MEQFEREKVRLDLNERGGRRMSKSSVGVDRYRLEFGGGEIAADEFGHDPRRSAVVAQPAERPDVVRPPLAAESSGV